jgi:hypothetical protein
LHRKDAKSAKKEKEEGRKKKKNLHRKDAKSAKKEEERERRKERIFHHEECEVLKILFFCVLRVFTAQNLLSLRCKFFFLFFTDC